MSESRPDHVIRLLARLDALRTTGHEPTAQVNSGHKRRGRFDLLGHDDYTKGFVAGVDAAIRAVIEELDQPASDDTATDR